ncbi:MAG: leucine-rich repeat domain-containing protein [Roseomonas sp.]|nr:leucine-rich repeat domain-containing protein [Roseomonas sp.]
MADMTEGERIAEERIAEAARRGQDWLDLGGLGLTKFPDALSTLTKLKRLSLGNFYQVTAEGVNDREDLYVESTFSDVGVISSLSELRELFIEGSKVSDLTPIKDLLQLQRLDCSGTQVSDLTPIKGLLQLQHLDCGGTEVSDLTPIKGLLQLQHLDCSGTEVSDLTPIKGLLQLQHLVCSLTQVSDLTPIKGLLQLQDLGCSFTKVRNLTPIKNLLQLQHLACGGTKVSDLTPIKGLLQLQHLNCSFTEMSDLTPIKSLLQLQHLNCSHTQVSDLTPIKGLLQLQRLDCGNTQVSDLTHITGLLQLQHLDISECNLATVPVTLWQLPSLIELYARATSIPGIPDEVLGYDCLERLRAHLAELEAGAEQISEAKLLLLGNGRAGKTQIARRLASQPFQPHWDSTHGIRITQVTLPAQDSVPETRLKLWDFGGQEIYHGTHALFARTRAIFLLVWSRETELLEAEPDQHGMAFRNHPLRYWHAYARDAGLKGSPLIIAQTRLDQDGILPPPLDQDQMASSACVQVSTADPPRINTLRGALQDAVVALHQSRGAVEIGKPRILLQRRIEKLRQPDGSLPEEWRLMEKSTFADWYREEGGIASAEYALAYLNDNGTVFYREGLFQNRIVLDQNWAMAAIYALFDRNETYGRLQRRGGLFDRADLAQVWRDYSEAEQRLFLSMMTSCGICFVFRTDEAEGEDGSNTIYLAPEFLPDKTAIQGQIDATWGEGPATHRQVFTYAFLHEGLIRNVISQLGTLAQTRADYFRGGVCLYDAQTRARALVTQHLPAGEWQGIVTIETKDGDAARLLEKLAELVSEENRKLNLSATTDQVMLAREAPAPAPQAPIIQATRPPEERPKYAISYAWNETDSTGPDLEAPVDLLTKAAAARDVEILRDTTNLVPGDSIHAFRQQIARSPRIFVFLSDRYLRSLNCMAELYEIWRECDRSEVRLREKLRIFKFAHLKLSDPLIRAGYRNYWATQYEQWRNANKLSSFLGKERDDFRIIEDLYKEDLGHLLYLFNDIIRNDSIEEFVAHAFD